MKVIIKPMLIIYFLLLTVSSCNNEELFEEKTILSEEETDSSEDVGENVLLADDVYTTNENTSVILGTYANDKNIPANFTITFTNPLNGELTIDDNETPNDLTDDSVTYTPTISYFGIDSFEYTICDVADSENCDTATVTIVIEAIEDDIATELKAFPGAEGFGKNAIGGRGGRVIKVTNLNDSGAGSFREACEASGARIVVFDVGGRINLSSTINISNPFITIAGQHSVGDGITLSMEGTPNKPVLSIHANDVIMRYITMRRSETEVSEQNSDCLVIRDTHDVIIDHCSFSWASDENIAIYDYDGNNSANTYNITIQNSLIDTAWGGSDKGIICAGGVDRLSFYNLLFTDVFQRSPLIKNQTGDYATEDTYFEIVNTVTFEGKLHASFPNNVQQSGIKHLNYINNICIDSGFSRNMLYVSTAYPVSIFTEGNISPLRTSITSPVDWGEEWSVIQPGGGSGDVQNTLTTSYRATTPKNTPIITDGVVLVDAINLFDSLKDHVGASLPTRDSEDARAINDVETQTSTSSSTSGTFPTINNGTPLADTDNDGMLDLWETTKFGNLSKDGKGDDDGDGYTDLEEFLNMIGA